MNKKKVLFLTALFLVAAVFAAATRLMGNNTHKEPFAKESEPLPQEVSNDALVEERESFLLIAEDNYLNLYNTDRNGALKKSEQIDFNLFPDDDVEELRKGKTFDNETEAYEMMENFIN